MGKRVLVTGAGGFIGSHLVERLVRTATRFGRSSGITARRPRASRPALPAEVQAAIEVQRGRPEAPGGRPRRLTDQDWVFHLGALIAIPYSYQNPYDVVQTNVLGTAHVLDACRSSAALERVVLTSTSEVYGTARTVPIDEGHPLQGQSPYAATQDRRRCAWARAITAPSACPWRSCGRSTRSAPGSRPGPSSRPSSARR